MRKILILTSCLLVTAACTKEYYATCPDTLYIQGKGGELSGTIDINILNTSVFYKKDQYKHEHLYLFEHGLPENKVCRLVACAKDENTYELARAAYEYSANVITKTNVLDLVAEAAETDVSLRGTDHCYCGDDAASTSYSLFECKMDTKPLKLKKQSSKPSSSAVKLEKKSGLVQSQIGAYDRKSSAISKKKELIKRNPALFASKDFVITETRRSGHTLYRLRVNFDTRKEAMQFCNSVKSVKELDGCFVASAK